MTKRIERVYQFVAMNDQFQTGLTTNDVAEGLTLQRTNVSKDLNKLVRAERLFKIDGRPVRYAISQKGVSPKENDTTQEFYPKNNHVLSYKENPTVSQKKSLPQDLRRGDIFSRIIGSNGSMKNAVEQAKAAILYPPRGLNCLITGPTGSGKTYFAHAMFRFAITSHVIEEEKELIVFNCADYANNPELLMSHLFGYVKGALTGAEQDKTGIIDQADGGMLFLDEIHRLPPEGQEMVFYFMDHGTFSRLGESSKNHKADVRIVGATTEDPSSSLLDTFVRRIPINIQLPAFDQRPASEKVDLVKVMVAQEAGRIDRQISLTEDVVKALIGSVSYGNIGQLKSNVQLVCARGFLNHMNSEEMNITIDDLPEGIRSGLLLLANKREVLNELSKVLDPKIVIAPNDQMILIQQDTYELPYNLYDIIGDKAALLKADGLDQKTINHFISTDINVHLKSFYKNHGFAFNADNKLAEFVDQKVIDTTNHIYDMVREKLGYAFQQNFVYAMSLHISSFLKKLEHGEERSTNDNIRQMVAGFPAEFQIARKIRHYISESFTVEIPESEDYYLAVLLISLRANQKDGKIGVVVAAHGNSTATSMVEVVTQLLDIDQVQAVDMPLDMPPKIALEKVRRAVTEVDDGSGVMLLVDMGSLATFGNEITQNTGIEVRTIDMVTTAVVLETVRKASVLGTDLDSLYEALHKFNGYTLIPQKNEITQNKPTAILAVCASGEGTAQRIKEIIQRSLSGEQKQLQVITQSVVTLPERLQKIQNDYNLLAATGIVDPKINAPFIPLDRFINQDVKAILNRLLLDHEQLATYPSEAIQGEKAVELINRFIHENFTFINGDKLAQPIWDFVTNLVEDVGLSTRDFGLEINLALHTAGVLERVLLKQPLAVTTTEAEQLLNESLYEQVHNHIQSFGRMLRLNIPPSEEYYVLEVIKARINESHKKNVSSEEL